MAQSSIHIEKGNAGFLTHNDRSRPTKNSIFHDEKNEILNASKEAFKIYRDELQKRSEAYTNRTKQKLQKNAITHLSAIVNLNFNHTLENLKPLISHLETELDTKVFQVAIHRDEGHIKNGKDIKNYHAHFEFLGLDSQGSSVRRKLTKKFLSDLQTKTAELLKMERGKKHSRAKRLDTYEFKNHKQKEETTLKPILAKVKDLTALNNQLREQLKQADLDKETKKAKFRELEQTVRELKEQIKAKDLTVEELKEKLQAPKIGAEIYHPTLKFEDGSKATFKATSEHFQKQLSEARETILNHEATISSQKELIVDLRANISRLEHKINKLVNELKSYRGTDRQVKRKEVIEAKQSLKSEVVELSSLKQQSEATEKHETVTPEQQVSKLLNSPIEPFSTQISKIMDTINQVSLKVHLAEAKEILEDDDISNNQKQEQKDEENDIEINSFLAP